MAETNYRIKKDDQVMVVSGKEKGKSGKVNRVDRKRGAVMVENLNMIKRHTKPSATQKQGGIIEKEAFINISNVMFFCNKCSKPVRVGKKTLEDGTRVRSCKKCGEVLDK